MPRPCRAFCDRAGTLTSWRVAGCDTSRDEKWAARAAWVPRPSRLYREGWGAVVYGLSLLGYCLMSNHVHLIAVPQTAEALSRSLKQAHGRYAAYWTVQQSSTGHVWQGRFYSCPLDESHLWKALRYVELNPVRARLVATAEWWRWSSAAAHCGRTNPDPMLEIECWRKRWTAAEWREFIDDAASAADVNILRHSTHTGRPLGSPEFVAGLEELTSRPLAPRKGGRPKKPASDCRQASLISVA